MVRGSGLLLFFAPLLLGEQLHELSEGRPLPLEGTVSSQEEKDFMIHVSSKRPLKIIADADRSSQEFPVLFSLRREDNQHSWRIPASGHYNSSTYRKVLCEGNLENHTMRLFVSSRSSLPINFKVRLEIISKSDFELQLSSAQNPVTAMDTRISPTEMALYQFVLPEDKEMALLVVKSKSSEKDQFCSILSIQPRMRCPEIHDQERDMRSGNGTQFQTFLGTAALVIERSRYPEGIHVVLLVQEKDKGCYKKNDSPHIGFPERKRTMNITVEVQKLEASKMESTIAILVFYFAIAVLAGSLSHFSFRYMLFEFEGKFGTLRMRTVEKQQKKDKIQKQFTSTFGPVKAVNRWRNSALNSRISSIK